MLCLSFSREGGSLSGSARARKDTRSTITNDYLSIVSAVRARPRPGFETILKHSHVYEQAIHGRALKRCFACGSMVLPYPLVRFFALRAKKQTTKEDNVPLKNTVVSH